MNKKFKEFLKDYAPLVPILLGGLTLFLSIAKLCDLFM